jgi:hypothetical protein
MVLLGLGIGASFPVISMSALHNMDIRRRGSVTSLVTFFRSVGSAIGVAVLGSVQVNTLSAKIKQAVSDPAMADKFHDARVLLQPQVRASIPADILHKMIAALADSIAIVFQITVVMAFIALIFVFLMGKAKLEIGKAPVNEGAPSPT